MTFRSVHIILITHIIGGIVSLEGSLSSTLASELVKREKVSFTAIAVASPADSECL